MQMSEDELLDIKITDRINLLGFARSSTTTCLFSKISFMMILSRQFYFHFVVDRSRTHKNFAFIWNEVLKHAWVMVSNADIP